MQNNESECALVAHEHQSSPEGGILHAQGVSPYSCTLYTLSVAIFPCQLRLRSQIGLRGGSGHSLRGGGGMGDADGTLFGGLTQTDE